MRPAPSRGPLPEPGGGRYQLLEHLAAGGMATVWRCRDRRLGVDRAIKLLDPDLAAASPGLVARFEQEARILARLEHPHVVPVHDAGVDERGPWLVMTLLPRGSLGDRVARDGPLPWPDAVRAVRQVLLALVAAHAAGVVHRDVKPHNVLIDDRGAARLGDFGVARAPDRAGAGTGTEEMLGTWRFMAPEQRLGARHADARTDVYAVGALLVAIATDRDPTDLLHPESRAVLLREIPVPWRGFVDRCTRIDPAGRYPSASAALRALDAGKAPARARRASTAGRALLALAVGLLAVAVASASAALGVVVARHAGPHPSRAATSGAPAPSGPSGPTLAAAVFAPPRVPLPPEVPRPAPAVPVRVAVAGAAVEVVIDGRTRGWSPWSGRLGAGAHALVLRDRAGRAVYRRTWEPAVTPRLCLDSRTWAPCAR